MRTRYWFKAALAMLAGLVLLEGAAWGAYADNGDGTVTDTVTGLMWQKADDGQQRTWLNALSYCEALDLADRTDWRLPNIRELRSILDQERDYPAINPVFSCRSDFYWSGSTIATSPGGAWGVFFDRSYADGDDKTNSHYVRCVRGGSSGSLGHLDILYPDGGEVLVKGQNFNIAWNSQNVTGTIQIDLYKGGKTSQYLLRQISAAAPNTGSYPFTPPDDIPNGRDYLIRVSSQDGTISDFSNAFFRISDKSISKSMPWLPLLLDD